MAAFLADVVPEDILDESPPQGVLPPGCGEAEALAHLREIAASNDSRRSLIGLGYYGTATPALIQRHVFENPAWYTAYTPYQAEIAQGRPSNTVHRVQHVDGKENPRPHDSQEQQAEPSWT